MFIVPEISQELPHMLNGDFSRVIGQAIMLGIPEEGFELFSVAIQSPFGFAFYPAGYEEAADSLFKWNPLVCGDICVALRF